MTTPFRILIIDADAGEVAMFQNDLSKTFARSFEITSASNGRDGVSLCNEPNAAKFDCVLLDLDLPDRNGIDVLDALKDASGSTPVPVVVLTGSRTETGMASAAVQAGAQDQIGKARLTGDGLVRAIENAVDRFALQSELHRRERELETLLNHAPDVIARVDLDGRLLYVNSAVERLAGRPAADTIGRTFQELGRSDVSYRSLLKKIREVAANRIDVGLDFDFDTPTGLRSFQASFVPEFAVDGSIETILIFARDITESKRAQEALKEDDRRKNDFLAMLAHELRNPLAAIQNAVELLPINCPDDPDLVWSRDVIARQAQHLARLTDDLLDVSRIAKGKIRLQTRPIDARTVIEHAVEAVSPMIQAKSHRLAVDLGSEPLPIVADPTRLGQAFANLIANAAKYTDANGSIAVSSGIEEGAVVVRVVDTGIGLTGDQLRSIFALFAQVDAGIDRSQGGLGIGLTLAKSLVELHGGTISARSAGPGRGSTFAIRLPLADDEPA